MPASEYQSNTGGDPLALPGELVQWLLAGAVHVALGLLAGLVVAHLMRRNRVHWSWSACALAPALLMHQALAGSGTTVAVALLLATALGRRWHREDLDAGADLARQAARLSSPLAVATRLLDTVAPRKQSPARAGSWRGEEILLGHDRDGREVTIPLGGDGGGTHTIVVGAAGSGKTVTQTSIARRAIERGFAVVVIDPKDDPAMRSSIRLAAEDHSRPFVEWTPEGSVVYNPYARGSETEIADKVLAAERFTEPHYLRQSQRYLGHAVRAMRAAGTQISLAALVGCLDPSRLEQLARELPESQGAPIHSYLDSLTPRQARDLAGVRDRLAVMAESDVGRWLDPSRREGPEFDLLESIRGKSVVLFSLQADRRPLLAQMLGAAIVQDLQTAVADLQSDPVPSLVVIDEFSAVAAEQVVRVFARARSAGMSLVLGTQEISDLRLPGREALFEQVSGNLTTLIAHRQVVPSSAALIASMAGTEGAWRVSRHSRGSSTRTRVLENRLWPEDIRSLPAGWAAVLRLTDCAVALAQILR